MTTKRDQPLSPGEAYEPPQVDEIDSEASPAVTAAGNSVTDNLG